MDSGFSRRTAWLVATFIGLAFVGIWALLPNLPAGAESVAPTDIPWGMSPIVENVGQFDRAARFQTRHGDGVTWVDPEGIWLTVLDAESLLEAEERMAATGLRDVPIPVANVRLSFVGANPAPALEPFDPLSAHVSYLIGDDPAGWRADVPVWGGLRYRNLYPGIDLVLSARRSGGDGTLFPWHLELTAGADPRVVQLRVEGAQSVQVAEGQILVDTSVGRIGVPLLGLRGGALPEEGELMPESVAAEPGSQAFVVSAPLATGGDIVTPAALEQSLELFYSTYLGGSDWDRGYGIAVDSSGMIYVAGRTPSSDFPTTPGTWDTTLDVLDAFVVKVNPAGNGLDDLVYATFIGGGGFDSAYGLALSGAEANITGETDSSDFPTTAGAFDQECGSDGACNGETDTIFARLNTDGTALLYSTHIGGKHQETGNDIAIMDGNAFIAGWTRSSEFPTTESAYDRSCGTDGRCNPVSGVAVPDAFLVEIVPNGNGSNDLLYGTYIGGAAHDEGNGIATAGGHAFVTGESRGAIPGFVGYAGVDDAFAARIAPAGNGAADLIYGIHLGGTGDELGSGIAVRGSVAFVSGETRSSDFLSGTIANSFGGGLNDAFVAQLDADGAVTYAAYLGGDSMDFGHDVAIDSSGAAVVVGYTWSLSTTFPVTEQAYDQTQNGERDIFLARIDLASSKPEHITYATYLGGAGEDDGVRVALDSEGLAYLTGNTRSADYPTTVGALDTTLDGTRDGIIAKLQVALPPALRLEKRTNGVDADEPPGPYLLPGDPITWEYVVTNAGGFVLNDIVVSDDQGVSVWCPGSTLLPDAGMTCTATGSAHEGQYSNLGTATGIPPEGLDPAVATDLSHYFGAAPELDLEKFTNGYNADEGSGPLILAGETVTWTYTVTNTGNVVLSGVVVTDDLEGNASCPYASLGPKQSMTCIITATATVDQYANLATAVGFPPGGLTPVSDGDPSHYFGADPAVSLEKHTNGQDADTMPGPSILVGDPVEWTYIVTNTGNVPLSGIAVADDGGVEVVCLETELAVDASTICTATGLAEAGQYTNTATVTAVPPVGSEVSGQDSSHYFGVAPGIAIEKGTNGEDADSAPGPWVERGALVSWTYVVRNTGNVPLTAIEVTDDQGVGVTCPRADLAVDDVMTCTAEGTAVSGQYGNLGTVTATTVPGELDPVAVLDSDPSHYYGSDPALTMVKLTNGEDADATPGVYILVGDTVTWTYVLTNTGNVTLTNVTVTDDQLEGIVGCPGSTLPVGETMRCIETGEAVADQYMNTGIASGTPPVGEDASASDLSHYFGVDPGISLEKRTNDWDADDPPGPTIQAATVVTWTYIVTNTGNVALSGVTVTDDQVVGVDCPTTELAVDASTVCTATGVAIVGQYTNTSIVVGSPPGGLPLVSDRDTSHYFGGDPAIDVEKHTNGQDADSPSGPPIPVGMPVQWEYEVRNVGNLPLSGIEVTDSDPDVEVSCPKTALAVGESMLCTAESTAETGQYSNTAVATGIPPDDLDSVSDSDDSHYIGINPAIDLEKHTNGQDADAPTGPYIPVGETVTWTYHVTNTGDILLLDVAVFDDQLGDITCPKSSLAEGDAMICTVTGVALEGQQANEGRVSAVPAGTSVLVTDTDSSHYYGARLTLTIEKSTNGQDADEPPGPLVLEDGVVSWVYWIDNSSNVTLTQVTLIDNVQGEITCPQSTLRPGESMTCVDTGSALSAQYMNLATVSGMPPGGLGEVSSSDPSHYYGVSPSLELDKRTNGQDADDPPGPYFWEGTPVSWTYSITNTGNITLTDLVLVDDQFGPVECPSPTLAASESMTCQAEGVAELGQYVNLAEVAGTPPIGPDVSASDSSHYFGISPSIEIDKYTNGWDADEEPWPTIYAGEVVTWTYVVTNSGDIQLTQVVVTDDQLGSVECPLSSLDASETMTCEVTGTAVSGSYENWGLAVGKPPAGPDVSASDPSHYLGRTAEPAIDIEKRTNGLDADTAPGPYVPVGELVTWTYVVKNTGNVEVTSIAVTDSDLGDVTCPLDSLGELESMVCTANGSAVAGQYANLATVTGTADPGSLEPVHVTDSDPSHYFGSAPAIELVKLTNGLDADEAPGLYILAGEPITWTYIVTNPGNVRLTEVTVTDDPSEAISCPGSVLEANSAMTCTATAFASAGQYANLATARGTPPVGPQVDATDPSHYFGVVLAASFEKRTEGQDADDAPGPLIPVADSVEWTYHITNTGNVTLSLSVSDSEGVAITCEEGSVAPDATMTCSGQGSATAGQYANLGRATLAPPGDIEPLVLTDASHYFGTQPAIELQKYTNGVDADEEPGPLVPVGDPVLWTYHLSNTGNITLTDLLVTDDQDVEVGCPSGTLAPDEEMVCTATGTASRGQYSNMGTVVANPTVGDTVVATDASHYFGTLPSIDLEKHTNGEDADLPPGPSLLAGQMVAWTYHVTNTGNITLTEVNVTDDQGIAVSCPRATLGAGEDMTCTAVGEATAGQYINVGLARGTPPVGSVVSDSDPSHYSAIAAEPALGIQKLTNGEDADEAPGPYVLAGEPVEWVYLVTNAGNVALTDIVVMDDRLGAIDCPKSSLEDGEWMECRFGGVAQPGQYSNRGTVTGTPPIGSDIRAYDDSHYFGMDPSVALVKRTNGIDAEEPPGPYVVVGEAVQWTYVVTNSGNVALTQVVVSDDQGVDVSCPDQVLGVGESMTCTGQGLATAGQYDNVGAVEALPPEGEAISATDASYYFGIDPGIGLAKYTNGSDADEMPGPYVLEGLSVEWTYVVSNTGDVELTGVTVIDDQGVEPDCPQTTLAVGEVMTCTASSLAVVGQYENMGTASGTHPGGALVQASDPSHYLGIAIRPVVDVQKRTNGRDADLPPGPYIQVGYPVEWEYLVTNSGNVTLIELTVVDDQGVAIACPGDALEPVQSMLCTGSGIAEAGQYTNVVTATGVVLRTGEIISDTDPSHYFGSMPGIELEKLTNGSDAEAPPGPYLTAGQTVTWSYRVINAGNVPLTEIAVLDDQGLVVSCPATTLNAGETMTCTATGEAQAGPYVNIGSVLGVFDSEVVSDSDPSHYYGYYTIYLPVVLR